MFKIARGLDLPLDFVTSTQAILAIKGAGKSYCASVQAEQLLKHNQQVIVIDPTGAWWGLRSSASGKGSGYPIAVFGGDHADVPLERNSGDVIATAVVAEGFSAVLDLSHFRKGELRRFMYDFLGTLFLKNREAMHLFIDEADLFAPQRSDGEVARVLGAMEDIVRRGRIRGIGCTMITQRPAVLNKNVMTQADMLTCLRMSHQLDLKAIGDWVAVHADVSQWKTMQKALPNLPTGTAWFWNPAAELFMEAKVNKRHTFDSGATPKAGQRRIEPRKLAKIDVKKLGEAIAASVERAKENDPDVLHARIQELEARLEADDDEPRTVQVEVPVMDEHLQRDLRYLQGCIDCIRNDTDEVYKRLGEFVDDAEKHLAKVTPSPEERRAVSASRVAADELTTRIGPVTMPPRARSGKGRMTNALAFGGEPLSRDVLAIWSLMSPSSGTFTKYLSELKRDGFLTVDGGVVELTNGGRAGAPADGLTAAYLQQQWASKFKGGGKRRIFDALLQRKNGCNRAEVAVAAQLESSSGTFTKYLSEVRKTGILVERHGLMALHRALWMEK